MNNIEFNVLNDILNRNSIYNDILSILNNKNGNKYIYIYGNSGTGKTQFIIKILENTGYDFLLYDASNIRNKATINDITKNSANHNNILTAFNGKKKQIAIIMDEIDGMNSGDKGGINALIKVMRPKKKIQDEIIRTPIICIGNYKIDKKMKELMKICKVFELKKPTNEQMLILFKYCVREDIFLSLSEDQIKDIINYTQNDLRKINNISNLINNNHTQINDYLNIFQYKFYGDTTKKITEKLLKKRYTFSEHNNVINETERTSVGLLWHENIINAIDDNDNKLDIYLEQLDNICFSDYIDRITFQKQIWQFNEMSSLIKTMKNNYKLFEYYEKDNSNINLNIPIQFTKVLTKYSTEYNNFIFLQKLCQLLSLDKSDLFGIFYELFNNNSLNDKKIISAFETYGIKKLDIQRMSRFLDKYINETEYQTNILEKEKNDYVDDCFDSAGDLIDENLDDDDDNTVLDDLDSQ